MEAMDSQWMYAIPTCSNSDHITHFYTPNTEGTPLPMDHILIMKLWGIKSTDKSPLARKSELRCNLLKWAIKIRKVETKLLTATHQFQVIPKEKWPVHFSPKHKLPCFFFPMWFFFLIVLSTSYLHFGKFSRAAIPRGMLSARLQREP